MNFMKHSNLEGQHAFLGASKYHWINYDEEKLTNTYYRFMATLKGTELHDFAARCIKLGQKLPKSHKTLNMYVNDAIGFKMTPEQILYYLKTGEIDAHMEQLMIYAALFCLEYKYRPSEIQMELRIYQNDDILVCNPTAEDIVPIMDKIITFDKVINKIKREEIL